MTISVLGKRGADPVGIAAAVQLTGVTKVFGEGDSATVALAGVDLTVDPGEFVTVVGTSGCGKSTVLSLVAGLEQPTSGTVATSGPVAFMFQDATLLPWLTAQQNVELALRVRGVPRAGRRERAAQLLDVVRLTAWGDKRPHELSGGMRQRVALARCLAQDTSIVLMDEPLGALDAMTRDHLHDEIERVAVEQVLTVLFVTHNMREAIRLGDRVVLMGQGGVLHEEVVDLPRPRHIDSPEVATRAAAMTQRLRGARDGR